MGLSTNTDKWINGVSNTFWESIEKARDSLSINMSELSRLIGKQANYYLVSLSKKTSLKLSSAMELCSVLGLTISEALHGFSDYDSDSRYGAFYASLFDKIPKNSQWLSEKRLLDFIRNKSFLCSFVNPDVMPRLFDTFKGVLMLPISRFDELYEYMSEKHEFYYDRIEMSTPMNGVQGYLLSNNPGFSVITNAIMNSKNLCFEDLLQYQMMPNYNRIFWDEIIRIAEIGPRANVNKLAKFINIDSNQLQKYLNLAYSLPQQTASNIAEPRIDTVIKICDNIGVEIGDVFKILYSPSTLLNAYSNASLDEYYSVLFREYDCYLPLLLVFYYLNELTTDELNTVKGLLKNQL